MYRLNVRLRIETIVNQSHIIVNNKNYHSEKGVYGYKPKIKSYYEILPEYLENRAQYSNFYRLVQAYREHGHKLANIDPISLEKIPKTLPELNLNRFNLQLNNTVKFRGILYGCQNEEGTVKEAMEILNDAYLNHIATEFSHLETEEEREWFAERVEICRNDVINIETKKTIAKLMIESQNFDNFMAKKFISVKRYGCEGAESMMAFFHELFNLSSNNNVKQIVLSMPHRGRLNLLTGMLKFPAELIFRKLNGQSEFPENLKVTGDVLSHFSTSIDLNFDEKKLLRVSLLYNPSHLEAVNPVSMGKTRSIMQEINEGDYSIYKNARWSDTILNIQVHGDAAFAGQGINQETLSLTRIPHFEIGGTIHMIVNNQLGFTAPPSRTRSSKYCTDLGKSIAAPIIHVNGDEPEDIVKATRIAFDYQRKFRKDIFLDINCYRKWGHNELDDPTFTNPQIYKIINSRKSIPDKYYETLNKTGILNKEEHDEIIDKHNRQLKNALENVNNYKLQFNYFTHRWKNLKQAQANLTEWDTGVDLNLLQYVIEKSVDIKENFEIHPKLKKNHIQSRLKKLKDGINLDWSTAESAAFGSLLYQGYNIRLSGQDVGRGTFSQRHAMLIDQSTGEMYIPLNSMVKKQIGQIELANSILSEEAVLGFEYGISINSPMTLTIWEAQFGDFFNGAQIIIDTFITSGETKWMINSGLIMILPHGYDGAGPEHSSCRIERFLQLTDSKENSPDSDNVNIQIANPTTPAQYFHLLRRQMVRNFRKPLIIILPKILLRHPLATSNLYEMTTKTLFKNVLSDNSVLDFESVERVIFVSGKHYYALIQHREMMNIKNIPIVRIESLSPFPLLEINEQIQKYPHAQTYIWSQEEPRNMGAWTFIKPRFENLCGRRIKYCGRDELPAPAVGIAQLHQRQAQEVIKNPFTMK
ncbi:hypothetical protein PV326_000066 [Microctonus aethiopoides]|nr:hypothetical protein PV326_000066 [Microctonus aethiopoides]